MYNCLKCNKDFKYQSEFNRHKNKKLSCDKIKINIECKICNLKFNCQSEKNRHEKTQNHINKLNNEIKPTLECTVCKVGFNCKTEQNRHGKTKKHINKLNNTNFNYNIKKNIDNINLENENVELKEINTILENKNIKLENENIELMEIIKNLENEFNLLKQLSNNQLITNEYIYIVHERTFVLTNVNIYKIGKTKNIKNRMNNYTKGSVLLFTIPCTDSNKLEKIILNYLKQNDKYIQVKDYGNEYFACDINHLINDIHILVNQNN